MISKNQIKFIRSLHLKKNRDEEKMFIIEGVKLVSEFLSDTNFRIKELFATPDYMVKHLPVIEKRAIAYVEVTTDDLNKISLQTTPNKVLALVYQNTQTLNKELLQTGMTLYLDDIRDPGNLGTMIRVADWFGVKQVICSQNCTELYNPKTLQASMGAVLRVNVVNMPFQALWPLIEKLPVYGAVLDGKPIYTSTLKKGILVIGNEANGISPDILHHISHPITIPSAPSNGSESLNAANACAIICGEFYRQLHEA